MKLTKQEAREAITAEIEEFLKPLGFTHNRQRRVFDRKQEDCTERYVLIYTDNIEGGSRIEPEAAIRVESVERLFHAASYYSESIQDTSTLVAGVYFLDQKRYKHLLHGVPVSTEKEVGPAAEQLFHAFKDVALPFYERFSTLNAIDAHLNDKPKGKAFTPWSVYERAARGIVVAKLVGRKNYDKLVKTYRKQVKKYESIHLSHFEALVQALENPELIEKARNGEKLPDLSPQRTVETEAKHNKHISPKQDPASGIEMPPVSSSGGTAAYSQLLHEFLVHNLSAREFADRFVRAFERDEKAVGEGEFEVLREVYDLCNDFEPDPVERLSGEVDEAELLDLALEAVRNIDEMNRGK